MFRTGGTPNEGIMHGLVDRRGYDNGGQAEKYADEYYSMLSKYKPPAPRFPMGQVGLNLVSGEYAGDGLLANVAKSLREPYSQWTQADDATRNLDYQARMSAAKMGISKDEAERLAMIKAKAKAAGETGFLKKETTEGAYEHFLEANLKSAAELDSWQKPNLQQKYPRKMAEFDSYVSRNLRATNDPQGKEIAANFVDFVPFDQKTQEFDYSTMMPGMYYYDPRYRIFVQRVPDDPNTPEDESGYFQYDNTTFSKTKLSGTK
jgi:hypothetical protein